ncbi:MFS transporter [Demequina sp. NBRC 110054]|uniref:MFS transporter n=1 Tax=Demequina sp. NBRC 110054 TaxID=1570343 RepID=UPI000A046E68|nr:MFS transporter [Demequina sp. NBRC 110054]
MSLRADLRVLWRSPGFRRLTWTRLLSQGGDGMFQVGIATAFFFDPTTATSPEQIAVGFAVLLAPFTLVGPFVGPLIDRWQRQRILLVGNLVRLVLAAGIITLVLADAPVWSLYATALLTLSVNRFLLAAMTAGLPQVVPAHQLLAANAVLPTLGTIAASVGGAIGGIATFVVPSVSDNSLAVTALICAGLAFGASSIAATRISRKELGPTHPLEKLDVGAQLRALTAELLEGERYLRARRTPWHALGVMSAQRLLYGLVFVASILASRSILADPDDAEAALGAFSIVLGFAAVGFGLAAVITPMLGDRVSRERWILICLGIGAVGQIVLATAPTAWALLTAAIIVSFAVQGGKIAVDTIVQRDTEDHVRGRAFTLYDMAYNVAFMSSAVVGGLILPDSGWSRPIMLGIAVVYVLVAIVFARTPHEVRPVPPRPVAN